MEECEHEFKTIREYEEFLNIVSKTKVYKKVIVQECMKCKKVIKK